MDFDWVTTLRVFSLVANVIFMILLPFAIHIRVDWIGRTWLLIGAIEIAWTADCIAIARRIIDHADWSWFVSPFYLVASVMALAYILRAGSQ
jgi:hypothetical protein